MGSFLLSVFNIANIINMFAYNIKGKSLIHSIFFGMFGVSIKRSSEWHLINIDIQSGY